MGKSKPPPATKAPPRHRTMEVQIAWLDQEEKDKSASVKPPSSRRGPPRLPGMPEIPPMPVPPSKSLLAMPAVTKPLVRRNTIEVEMDWVELVDNASPSPGEAVPAPAPAPPAPTKGKTLRPPTMTGPPGPAASAPLAAAMSGRDTQPPPPGSGPESVRPAKPMEPADLTKPRPLRKKPIPRED